MQFRTVDVERRGEICIFGASSESTEKFEQEKISFHS
jgi:hypothetical protein